MVPFDKLLAGVESVKEAIVTGRPPTIDSVLPDELEPPIAKRAETAVSEGVARRVWRKDETLWGGPGPEIGNRLGWLTISEPMLENAADLKEFAETAKSEGYTHVALLGMGGSSLGPEVIRRSFGDAGGLELHVLDSTDPGAIKELENRIDLDKTVFVVSSKSGGTVETLSHMKHFYERTGGSGKQFVAVTDPGSGLVDEAEKRGFVRVFQNDPNIGGRYSVLSYFGLVPGRLRGRGHRGGAGVLARGRGELQRLRLHPVELGPVAGADDGRAGPAGPRQAHLRGGRADLQLRPVGRAADRRVHRQGGQGHPAGGRRAAGRARRLRRRPRVRAPGQRRGPRRGQRREGRRAGQGRPGGDQAVGAGAPPRTWAGSSSSPSSPPRWRAGCWASTPSTSPTCRRPRTRPTRCWGPASRRRSPTRATTS